MTISRALRGDRGISAQTQARIRELANQHNYRPDPVISKLMSRLRKSRFADLEPLAWLTTYDTIGGWKSNPGTCEIYKGAVEQAYKLGYRLEEFSLKTPGMTPKRLGSILYNRSIRGIVLAPMLEHGDIHDFPWQHFATVCCGHSLQSPALNRVSVDQFEALRLAWAELVLRGYQRIGLCVSATDNTRIGQRWEGALLLESCAIAQAQQVPAMLTDDWSVQTFSRWFEQHRPDVVLSLPGTLEWMKELNIRVPQDCGFALLRLDQMTEQAGVDHHFRDIGASAVALVASDLNTNQLGIPANRKSLSVECSWHDGTTVRRPKVFARARGKTAPRSLPLGSREGRK